MYKYVPTNICIFMQLKNFYTFILTITLDGYQNSYIKLEEITRYLPLNSDCTEIFDIEKI